MFSNNPSAGVSDSVLAAIRKTMQIDEISANTAASYRKKTDPSEGKMDNLSTDKWKKRMQGRTTAADKLVGRARVPVSVSEESADSHFQKLSPKRQSAINARLRRGESYWDAVKKTSNINEEPEQVDELSNDTLKSYANKARMSHKDLSNKAAEATSKGFWERDKKAQKLAGKLDNKARKRADGIARAGMKQDRRSLTEDLTRSTRGKYFRSDMTGMELDPKAQIVSRYTNADNQSFKLYKDSNQMFHLVDSKRQILNTWHTDNKEVRQEVLNKYGLDVVSEDVEQVDEGRMTISRLRKHLQDGTYEAMQDVEPRKHVELRHTATGKRKTVYVEEGVEDSDKREVGTKSLLRTYLDDTPGQKDASEPKAVNVAEEPEQVDELSKATLGRYIKTARSDKERLDKDASELSSLGHDWKKDGEHKKANDMFHRAGGKLGKSANRVHGINRAVDKLVREEPEQIDEISQGTKLRYQEKATKNLRGHSDNWDRLAKKPSFTKREQDEFDNADKQAEKRYKGLSLVRKSLASAVKKAEARRSS